MLPADASWINNGRRVLMQPIVFAGGLDVMTPPFQMKPGVCRGAQNFECSLYGGYRRIAGYERYSGQAAPSDAVYTILSASSITGGVAGDTLTGNTSGATGTIIATTATYFVVTQLVGTFQNGEDLKVGGVTVGVQNDDPQTNGAATPLLNATYKNLAADVYRALISAVPGQGNILGVWLYNDVVYAFRNNVGATEAVMYKSTTAGWSAVSLGRELSFTTGTAAVSEGQTLTGLTSGASAVVARVRLESGTYGAGTAAGGFIFASVTGAFQNGENLQVGGVTKAVASGVDTAITLQPGGRFEFVNANFTGSTDTLRMYGCDGVSRAFEFDGTTFVPINTGMTTDTPTHIAFHLYHLVLSFNASVQLSSTGFPYQWTPVTGASELAMGDEVTGFSVQPAGTTSAALAVFTKGRLSILYGTGSSSFQLLPYRDNIGAIQGTIQMLAQTVFVDLQGITNIQTAIQFGNFTHAVISNNIKTQFLAYRDLASASCINRDLSQYRLFFSNGHGFYMSIIGNEVIGVMPVEFEDPVLCACEGQLSDNTEVAFFGSDTGHVYQFDKGTSFDGVSIPAYLDLAYSFMGGPRTLKRFRNGALEVSGDSYAEFAFGYSLGYGAADVIQPLPVTQSQSFSSVFWESFTWDAFSWDGVNLSPSSFEMDGEAENVSIGLTCDSDYFEPFTVTSAVLHYSPRRELR